MTSASPFMDQEAYWQFMFQSKAPAWALDSNRGKIASAYCCQAQVSPSPRLSR